MRTRNCLWHAGRQEESDIEMRKSISSVLKMKMERQKVWKKGRADREAKINARVTKGERFMGKVFKLTL